MRTWNYFNHDGPCTNNHIEGCHNSLKKMAQKAHPHLFEFTEVIQKEQAEKRKVVRREETMKKLTEEFTGAVRTLESFLSSIV